MRYLLDTHAWLWAVNGNDRLPERVKMLFRETPMADLALADISVLEVARKAATGQLAITGDALAWLRTNSQAVRVLPISAEIAFRSTQLDWEHKDPADRLIVATALEHKLTLITNDQEITRWGGVKVLW
ncbi:type II toxin-antitoxin system VapC family toxin [Opitutaceae bacterium]